MRLRRLLISTLVAGLMLAAAPAATPAGARTNSVIPASVGSGGMPFALGAVTADTFTVTAPDLAPGETLEVRASVGRQGRVFRGNMVRRCVSGAGMGGQTVPFGCHRAFTLKFGDLGVRKVELVKKDRTGMALARTTFFVSDPHRPRFLAKLAMRLCGQRCREAAEQLAAYDGRFGSLGEQCWDVYHFVPCSTAGAPSAFDPVAAREAAAGLYQCTGLSRARVVSAAAGASVAYAATTTRAEYLKSMARLSNHVGPTIFPADDRHLAHRAEELACGPCFAKLAAALGEIVVRPPMGAAWGSSPNWAAHS